MDLPNRIKWAREHAHGGKLTQAELARACGFASQSRIANYEAESSPREPSLPDLRRIAEATGTRPEWLILGSGDPVTGGSATAPTEPPGRPDRAMLATALQLVDELIGELGHTRGFEYSTKQRADLVFGTYIAIQAGSRKDVVKELVRSLLEAQRPE